MRKRSLVAAMCAVTLTLTAYGSNVSLCTVKAQGNSQENAFGRLTGIDTVSKSAGSW